MGERKTLFEGKGRRVTGLSPAKIGYMNRSLTRFSKNFESKCSFPSNSIRSMINFCPCMRSVEPLEWGSKRERLHGKLISLKLYWILVPFLHRLWNFLGLIISVIIILWSFPRKFPEINIWLLFYAWNNKRKRRFLTFPPDYFFLLGQE